MQSSRLLYRYKGHLGVYNIAGGVDCKGAHLAMISADGNFYYQPFGALGSGSLYALSIIESKYRDDMTKEEAIALLTEGVMAGIMHDLGSGSALDFCVLTKGNVEYILKAASHEDSGAIRTAC
jgi:20S proteasome subunit beta 2